MTSPGTVPTDSERTIGNDIEMYVAYGNGQVSIAAAVAQALADQRAKYDAVADELDAEADKREERFDATPEHPSMFTDRVKLLTAARHQRIAAKKIRRVAG